MNRHDRIANKLARLRDQDRILSWQAQGLPEGTRWTVEQVGGTTRTYTTREVEAFLDGAQIP